MEVRVSRKHLDTPDIAVFELVDMQGARLPPFSAGSHIDVHVPGGPVRQYSLCNSPTESDRYVIAVLRDPVSRGGSTGMHVNVRQGDTLTVSVPRNNFRLVPEAAHSILLAGGIGVTPMLSMAKQLSLADASFELHYCTRSSTRTAFREHIEQSSFADRARFYVDDDGPSRRLDLSFLHEARHRDTHLYVCGPPGFLQAVHSAAERAGWSDDQVHQELFAAAPVLGRGNTAFDVRLASTGRTVRVGACQSVVQALEVAGVSVPVACEQGLCGTCVTRILSGIPEHRDSYLSAQEQAVNDQFLPCCSRAKTPLLVLDL